MKSRPTTTSTRDQHKRRTLVEAGGNAQANLHKGTDEVLIEWALDTGRLVRIDRGTRWGNPCHIGKDGTRLTVIERYREWFSDQPELIDRLPKLRGKLLACWCHPAACHAQVLIEAPAALQER